MAMQQPYVDRGRGRGRGGGSGRGGRGRGGPPPSMEQQPPYYPQPQPSYVDRNQPPHYSNDNGTLHARGGGPGNARGRGRGNSHLGVGGGAGGGQLMSFEISGYPDDVQYHDFTAFFNANGGFRWVKVDFKQGGTSRMTVNASDANALMALTGREIRAGRALMIEPIGSSGRPLQQHEKQLIRQFITSRYDQGSKALDLSSLSSQLQFTDFNSKTFINELCAGVHEICPVVVSLNLAHNKLTTLAILSSRLTSAAPSLINLSLAHNGLDRVEQLDLLAPYRDQLNELILTGNPLAPPAGTTDALLYSHHVSAHFPNLKLLDGQPPTPLIAFDLPPMISTSALPPVQGSYFDKAENAEVVRQFVEKFFGTLDGSSTDREKLMFVYGERAMFSLTLPTLDSQQAATLVAPAYQALNRNSLQKAGEVGGVQKAAAVSALLKQGPFNIVHALKTLPQSQHHVDSFIADVMLLPSTGLLMVTIRGSLLEVDSSTLRAFHRVFLLSAPNADLRSKGWPVMIAHDQLFLGASRMQPTQQLGGSQSLSPLPGPSLSPSPQPGGVDVQSVVMQLSMQTGVDQATAMQVLQQSNGNVEQAYATIQAVLQQQQLQLG